MIIFFQKVNFLVKEIVPNEESKKNNFVARLAMVGVHLKQYVDAYNDDSDER